MTRRIVLEHSPKPVAGGRIKEEDQDGVVRWFRIDTVRELPLAPGQEGLPGERHTWEVQVTPILELDG